MSKSTALPYHYAVRDLLKSMDAKVWDWFGQQQNSPQSLESLKLDLLKSTYRLTPAAHESLYAASQVVADKLEITAPITLYQAQADSHLNASLVTAAEEIHIIFAGDIEGRLDDREMMALLGHEMGHYLLYQLDDGDHLRAWDMLSAICREPHPHPAFLHTLRRLALYTEVYCDQVALQIVGDAAPLISTVIKLDTGVSNIVADEFLTQAYEILKDSNEASQASTHPEPYIRAVAMDLAHKNDKSLINKLVGYIEGPADTGHLDLLRQQQLSKVTRVLLGHALQPENMRSDLMLSHVRLYFEDFQSTECRPAPSDVVATLHQKPWNTSSVTNYLCYVLLDIATADRNLEELPIASALATAEHFHMKEAFIPLLRKELKLRKNQIDQCDRQKQTILGSQA